MSEKRRRLKNLALSFVSLVDRGANPGARIALWKRDAKGAVTKHAVNPITKTEHEIPGSYDDTAMQRRLGLVISDVSDHVSAFSDVACQILASDLEKLGPLRKAIGDMTTQLSAAAEGWVGGEVAKSEDPLPADRLAPIKELREGLDQLLAVVAPSAEEDDVAEKQDRTTWPSEAQELVSKLEGEAESARSKLAKLEADSKTMSEELAKLKPAEKPQEPELPEPVRKQLEAQASELTSLRKAHEDLIAKQRHAELVIFAKSAGNVPDADHEWLANVLEKLESEDGLKLVKAFSTLNTQLDRSALFSEVGTARPQAGSADEEIEKLARARVAKGEGSKTYEQHYADVLQEHPDLYRRSLDEQRVRSH